MARPKRIHALAFDVFGTVADWRGSIVVAGQQAAPEADYDWAAFADAWMREYGKAVQHFREDWQPLATLLRHACYDLVSRTKPFPALSSDALYDLAKTWGHLRPHPDAVSAFAKLGKTTVDLIAFTNADTAMCKSLHTSLGLPFDEWVSSESVQQYKPAPEFYRYLINGTVGPPTGLMLVAAHTFDLNEAHRQGIRTALILRPDEPGSDPRGLDHEPEYIVPDLDALMEKLL